MVPVSYAIVVILNMFKYTQIPPLSVVVMVSESSSENRARQTLETCPECGGHAGPSDGFIVCKECGLTLGRELRASRYQIHDVDRGPTKAGTTQYTSIGQSSLIVDDLGSHVGYSDGRFFDHNARNLKRTNIQSRSQSQLTRHVRELLRIGGVLSISRAVLVQAIAVLKKALPHWKPRNPYPLTISCLTYALREFSVPILESEVLEVADRPRSSVCGKSLKRAKFYLIEELGLRFKFLSPLAFLPRVLTALRSNERVLERLATYAMDPEKVFAEMEVRAREVLSNLTFADHQGRKPMHLAVSCCHVLSHRVSPHTHLLTLALTSEVCGISIRALMDHHKFWKQVLPAVGSEDED